ncbi:MAG: hypothetical protein Q9160_001513 [Pyrenula sp. 1 TL-2023]
MHSSLTRIQSLFSLSTTIAFTLSALIALTPFLPSPSRSPPSATLTLRSSQVVRGRPHYYSEKKEEYAHVKFDLDADLSSLFTWNTKQLFVWVSAVYPAAQTGKTQASGDVPMSNAVIWDAIIPAPATTFAYANIKTRYLDPIAETAIDLYGSYSPFAASSKKKTPASKSKSKSKSKTKAKPSTKPSSSSSKSKKPSTETTKSLTLPGTLHLANQRPKYQITDISGVLAERTNATLQLSWNVQPWVGALVWDTGFLGSRIGRWEAGKGKDGVSARWDFPGLKGVKKVEGAGKVGGGEGVKVEGERREGKVREEGRAEPVGPTG